MAQPIRSEVVVSLFVASGVGLPAADSEGGSVAARRSQKRPARVAEAAASLPCSPSLRAPSAQLSPGEDQGSTPRSNKRPR